MADYKSKTIMTGEQLDAALLAALDCEANKDQALGAAANAKNYADSAEAAKTAAQQAAAEASASAQQAAESAAALSDTIADVSDLKAGLAKNTAADAATKRSLDALWKLNQGVSYQFETDTTEAYSKTVPTGAKCADVQMIGGKTVAWNQLVDKSNFMESSGIFTNNGDGSVTANGTPSALTRFKFNSQFTGLLTVGHKYYFGGISGGSESTYYYRACGGYLIFYNDAIITLSQAAFDDGDTAFSLLVVANAAVNITVRPFVIDLTQLYGAGNEPTTTGDPRIAWIEQYAAAHPEYNAGELVSADVESVLELGKNLLPYPYIDSGIKVTNGITFTDNDDGSVSIRGTATGTAFFIFLRLDSSDNAYKITLSAHGKTSVSYKGYTYSINKDLPSEIRVVFYFKDDQLKGAYIAVDNGNTVDTTVRAQIEKGDVATAYSPYHINTYPIPTSVRALPGYGWSAGDVYNSIERTDKGWQYVQRVASRAYQDGDVVTDGTTTYYELATPVITDITDMMTLDFDAIPVEAGGTVTFDNAAHLPVPNSIEYAVKLSEVSG